jgi:hypothetical protein
VIVVPAQAARLLSGKILDDHTLLVSHRFNRMAEALSSFSTNRRKRGVAFETADHNLLTR